MSKIYFYELSQCILSYHDWMKVDGLWDLLPNYQKNLTDLEHWKIIINTWSKSEHNSQIQNREKWIDILTMREPIKFFKKNLNNKIKIYRAGTEDGFSWTLRKKIAKEFQQRYNNTANPIYFSSETKKINIIDKEVKYEDVKFFNNLRGEYEIVIIP